MEKNELGLPWRIASQNYETCFYVIHGKDYSSLDDREIQILSMQYGSHPIKEHKDRIKANAELIVKAVNSYDDLQSQLSEAVEEKENLAIGFADWITGCCYDKSYTAELKPYWHDGYETIAETTLELLSIYKEHLKHKKQ